MKTAQPRDSGMLIISGTFPNLRCGVGDYVKKLIESLIKRNIDVKLLTSHDPSIDSAGYVYAWIKKWNVFSIYKILSFIKRSRPSLINLQVPTLKYRSALNSISFLPLLSKIFFNSKPFIVTIHDYCITKRFLKIFFFPLFLFANTIIITNGEDERDVVRHFPFFKRKIKKIYMGPLLETIILNEDRKEEFARKISYRKENRFISTLGFIKKNRCLDIIIKVFHKLSRDDGNLRLLILGDVQRAHDNKYKNYLYRLIDRLNLKGKIYTMGFCEAQEILFYLSISDLAILLYARGASFRRSSLINCIAQNTPILTNINKGFNIYNELVGSGMVYAISSVGIDEIYKSAAHILYNGNYKDEIKQKMKNSEKMFNWNYHTNEIVDIYFNLTRRVNAK